MGEIGNEVLDHVHVRQRRDAHFLARALLDRGGAGKAILAVHVHRTGTANAFAAGATEGQRRIIFILDLQQRVEDHRTAIVEVNLERVIARILTRVGIVAIDLEALDVARTVRRLVGHALTGNLAVLGQGEFGHGLRCPPSAPIIIWGRAHEALSASFHHLLPIKAAKA